MKIKFEIRLKETKNFISKESSNYVEMKKLKKFSTDLTFIPEISGLTFIADKKEIPVIYDKKEYSVKVIDEKTLELVCSMTDFNLEMATELSFKGIDAKKIDEIFKNITKIYPMYINLEINGYDMFTQDFDFILKEIELNNGALVKDYIVDAYNMED